MISLPSVAACELTYRCNHQCIFCSCPWESNAVAKGEEMTAEEWGRAFQEIATRGTDTVSFSGGEPTVRPDVLEIIDLAQQEGLTTCLISNGRAMDADLLAELHDRDVHLSISVPGIEQFERQTGHDGVEHVMELFRIAHGMGMRVTANIAVTKINLPEVYETVAYSLINGASYVLLNRFLPGGRGLDNTQFLLDRAEVNEMLRIADGVLAKAGAYGHVGTELPYCLVDDPDSLTHLQVSYQCGAAKSFYAIDPSGYVRTCNHSEQRLCSVFDIDKLAHDDYWRRFVERDYRPAMCDGCEHRDICDGGCREAAHVYGGDVAGNDPCFGCPATA